MATKEQYYEDIKRIFLNNKMEKPISNNNNKMEQPISNNNKMEKPIVNNNNIFNNNIIFNNNNKTLPTEQDIDFPDTALKDYAEICVFLDNQENVLKALQPLEYVLEKLFGDSAKIGNKVAFPEVVKLFSRVLAHVESNFGLNTSLPNATTTGELYTAKGFIDDDDMRTYLIGQGNHWKDPSVALDHGEYTHRLQWHAISMAKRKGLLNLTNKILYLFSKSPSLSTVIKVPKEERTKRFSMWDYLVDCLPLSQQGRYEVPNAQYFPFAGNPRCPSYLQQQVFLQESKMKAKELTFLYSFLANRQAKRVKLIDQKIGTKMVIKNTWYTYRGLAEKMLKEKGRTVNETTIEKEVFKLAMNEHIDGKKLKDIGKGTNILVPATSSIKPTPPDTEIAKVWLEADKLPLV